MLRRISSLPLLAPASAASATSGSLGRSSAGTDIAESGKLVRAFRADQVLTKIAPTDFMYAVQSAPNLFSFVAQRDASSLEVARNILSIEQNDRCVHAFFGRHKVPCDFYADIEFPTHERYMANLRMTEGLIGATSPEKEQAAAAAGRGKKKYMGEEIVIDVIKASTAILQERFSMKPSVIALFDGGATADKYSYHLHMRCDKAAFADFSVLQEVFSEVNFAVGIDAIDLACCRPNGMLRMGFTPKFSDKSRMMLPMRTTSDAELARLIQPMQELSQEQLVAMTLVSRLDELRALSGAGGSASLNAEGSFSSSSDFKLVTAAGGRTKKKKQYDASGRAIEAHLQDDKKPARFREVCGRLHQMPLFVADDYNTWVRIGLSMHSFGPDPAAYQHWLQFSAKSPTKFDPQVCEKYWQIFARRPDCYNWRRGYLYIMKTLSTTSKGQRQPQAFGKKK